MYIFQTKLTAVLHSWFNVDVDDSVKDERSE